MRFARTGVSTKPRPNWGCGRKATRQNQFSRIQQDIAKPRRSFIANCAYCAAMCPMDCSIATLKQPRDGENLIISCPRFVRPNRASFRFAENSRCVSAILRLWHIAEWELPLTTPIESLRSTLPRTRRLNMAAGMARSSSMLEPQMGCICPECGGDLSVTKGPKSTASARHDSQFEDVTPGELVALVVIVGFVAWAALSMLADPLRV